MKRILLAVCFVATLAFAGFGQVSPRGISLVPVAHADATAKVSVAVIKASKTGSTDDKSKKYSSVISQVGGYQGFTYVTDLGFDASLGQTVKKKVAGRELQVTVKSMSSDKVATAVTVVDPGGKKHAVSSSIKPGASVVVAARAADGETAHLFIVTVRY